MTSFIVGGYCGIVVGILVHGLCDAASRDQHERELSQARRAAVDAYFLGLADHSPTTAKKPEGDPDVVSLHEYAERTLHTRRGA